MIDLKIKENENEKQYLWRIGSLFEVNPEDANWGDVADIVNENFRKGQRPLLADTCYRRYTDIRSVYVANAFGSTESGEALLELTAIKNEIAKQRQELHDERIAWNKDQREHNRALSFSEKIKEAIDNYEFSAYSEYSPNPVHYEGESDLIIHLTDVHCGAFSDSMFNKYGTDVVRERLQIYLDNIFEIKNTHFAENAYVILGGDLISGLIHVNSRIEAKEDIVTQIMSVADDISYFIKTLSDWFNNVHVYSVVGNHGRAIADKDAAVRRENFDRLVPCICGKELKCVPNIYFHDNTIDVDIANFTVRGWNIWATHGDKDTPTNVVTHFNNFARYLKLDGPDVCYLGHRHCNGLTTVSGIKVVESGSTMGMDNYCVGRRLCGHPEQTVTVVTDKKALAALYDITLD